MAEPYPLFTGEYNNIYSDDDIIFDPPKIYDLNFLTGLIELSIEEDEDE